MVNPAISVQLVGIGATTGVGGTADVSMAAARAGITRTEQVSYGDGDDSWSHAVRVGTIEAIEADGRLRALVASTITQAWVPLKSAASGLRVGAWCAGPPTLPDLVSRYLALDAKSVAHTGEHSCAGLYALRNAWAALSERRIDVAVVVGVGLESQAQALQLYREQGRVLGGEWSFGTVPGEGAAALVWCSEAIAVRLGVASRGRLVAVATAEEKTPFGGPLPCVGNALIEAVRGALASLPAGERVNHVLCDLNGERERTDEWGFAMPRLSQRLPQPATFITPISAFGDVGAPSGLLLVALASAACSGQVPARCLIWTSSQGAPRAAALFEPAAQQAAGASADLPSPPAPAWALALDDSVLAEVVDDAIFRYDQRLFQYEQGPAGAPDAPRPALARVEACLDLGVTGLVDCGPRAWTRAEAALERPTPGSLYLVVRVLLEAGRARRASPFILEHAAVAPALGLAARLACQHARIDSASLAPIVDACLGAGPALAAFGLCVAVHNGIRPPSSQLHALTNQIPEDDVDTAAAWIDALCQLDSHEAHPWVQRWQFSRHDRLRRCWAVAELCLNPGVGRAPVIARSQQDPAVILPATMAAGGANRHALRELAAALSGADACLALGLLGDAAAVPVLINRLIDPSVSDAAAWALEILLGVAPADIRAEPDADPTAAPRQAPSVSRAPTAWQALADPIVARHPAQLRLRAGIPASVASSVDLIERLHLPMRVRRYLARELRVRWGVRPMPGIDGLLRQQRSIYGRIREAPNEVAAGAWG